MEITKERNNIVIKIPFWTKRCNPYAVKKNTGKHKTFVGLISKDESGNNEIGFAYVIDMDYKNKDDQFSNIIIHWLGDEKEFEKVCKKLEIGLVRLS